MTQTVSFLGNPVQVEGQLPQPGETVADFALATKDLADASLATFAGKKKVISVFPSVDTPTCAASVRKFNESASQLPDTVVLAVSADLPFAQSRFCGAEGLDNVVTLSTFRSADFRSAYGVAIEEGALAGLAARAVIVVDADNKVLHSELVSEISQEPDYAKALAALQ